uniref:D5-like helicase-primase n=1 Tax=Pithovirus LCPAC104 TaxID=2506589 RepID=A0A481Z3Q5_9VIRU|nr:MAG: D5-like helicase-primase [Pithovirus LCPAC104]
MNSNLRKLLNDVSIEGKQKTYYDFINKKDLCINDSKYTTFWEEYCELVNNMEEKEKTDLFIGEKINIYTPVISDFTFKFKKVDKENYDFFSNNFSIFKLIKLYQITLKEILNMKNNENLICCVLENPDKEYYENFELIRHRFIFPYCCTNIEIQNNRILTNLIDKLNKNRIIHDLKGKVNDDWNDIIKQIPKEGAFPMYFSSIKSGELPLTFSFAIPDITDIIDENCHENYFLNNNNIFHGDHLDKIFSLNKCSYIQNNNIEIDTSNEKNLKFWLPLFFSINGYCSKIIHPIEEIKYLKKIEYIDGNNIELSEIFIPMLDTEKFTHDYNWLDIGRVLYNCDQGHEKGLELWTIFTTRLRKDEGNCQELYKNFNKNNNLTIKTLAWHAREDSPTEYIKWHAEWVHKAIEIASDLTHYSVAIAIYRYFWLDILCSSVKDKKFFQFIGHRWKSMDSNSDISLKISEDFTKIVHGVKSAINEVLSKSNDENEKKDLPFKDKRLSKLIDNLKNTTYKKNVIIESMNLFKSENFYKFENANPNFMCLDNCVIETYDEYAIVRPGKPEDYITIYSLIKYHKNLNWDSTIVSDFNNWMLNCFPDNEFRKYFLYLLSSCLRSGNTEKIFPILTGKGDNSKSMIKKLCENIFGPYCVNLPTSIITEKRAKSSNATPELARARFAKQAWIQEPDNEDIIKNGMVKELTGGDTMFTRFLYDDGKDMKSTFTLFLQCNKIPQISQTDKATQNRIRIIPFLSTWIKNAPETIEKQRKCGLFQRDDNFEDKLWDMAEAAIWIMIETYPDYIKNGLKEPDIIKEYTQTYWDDNDFYKIFIKENIENIEGNVGMSFSQIYNLFKSWYFDVYPNKKIPDMQMVIKELKMKERLGESNVTHGWKNIIPIENI